jgi:hypothetical protein
VLSLAAVYLLPVYARPPIVLSHGKGSYVWDTAGRVYLDFAAGIAVNALGHGDEEFVKVSVWSAGKTTLYEMGYPGWPRCGSHTLDQKQRCIELLSFWMALSVIGYRGGKKLTMISHMTSGASKPSRQDRTHEQRLSQRMGRKARRAHCDPHTKGRRPWLGHGLE